MDELHKKTEKIGDVADIKNLKILNKYTNRRIEMRFKIYKITAFKDMSNLYMAI